MELLKRHLAHQTDYCVLEIDEYARHSGERMYLTHLRVLRWSPDAFRKIKHDWSVFRQVVTVPLFALPMLSPNDPSCEKWARFVEKLGWRPLDISVPCHDGEARPLYIHEAEPDRRREESA